MLSDYCPSRHRTVRRLTRVETRSVEQPINLNDGDDVFNWPWLYAVQTGQWRLTDAQAARLREYLLRGGFFMCDDFWGEDEWDNFYREIKRVFPDREPTELPLDHPIFHCVYDLKEKPQIPSIHAWMNGQTTERWDAPEPHYRALFDDRGRMMVIICHNTDLGDGWEREGEDPWYFHEFSEKKSYPLGINILFYN